MEVKTSRAWVRPELIEIVRGKQEETVLSECKNSGVFGGNAAVQDYCTVTVCGSPCNLYTAGTRY